jgi:coronin-7
MIERVENLNLDLDKDIDESGDMADDAHTPTTAERRRMFEEQLAQGDAAPKKETKASVVAPASPEEPSPEQSSPEQPSPVEEQPDESNMSIAERRRLYESRSMSVQEPTSLSPQPLRRRDSLKNNQYHETIKEESKAKPQLDTKKEKKPELATPTPKRTSTVFGECRFRS